MKRLDVFLVENGYVKSRKVAQELIKSGGVLIGEKVAQKCGVMVNDGEDIKLIKDVCPYVSRAGLKLEGACKIFNVNVFDKTVLDIGSSTGGFSDYCLKNGAKKVYCVDVGDGQLHESIKKDKRVVVYENTDIRTLTKNRLKDVNMVICDVSFISLSLISHKIAEFLNDGDEAVVLIKPQFECGKDVAQKFRGVIKDPKIHKLVIDKVVQDFLAKGLKLQKVEKSCILGTQGNVEFVALFKKMSLL